MTETDAAYIAGILDGEGYLFFANPGKGRGRKRPQMEVTSIDEELVLWLLETAGGYRPRTLHRDAPGRPRKPEHRWRANGRVAQRIARDAAPYMRIHRKRDLALSMRNW